MINCIYLNPTIDETIYLDKLNVGQTNYVQKCIKCGAGKALNVADVLSALGLKCHISGVIFNNGSELIQKRLNQRNIVGDFIKLDGHPRVNIKIFDESKKQITEINQYGMPVDLEYYKILKNKILNTVKSGDVFVFTGSLPINWPNNTYSDLISLLSEKGVVCALDASGDVFKLGIKAAPFIIKPNKDELQALTTSCLKSYNDFFKICNKIISYGVKYVCLSLGSQGAYMFSKNIIYYAAPIDVLVRSTVGAGDAMLAGILANINNGIEFAFKAGVAAAAASISFEGSEFPDISIYKAMLKRVKIKQL